jgi:hypothetical protein
VTDWLVVEEVTRKSCPTVSKTLALWLGAPVVSWELILMLYWPGFASFGTLIVAVRFVVPPLTTVSGFVGVSVHVAPGSELASQFTLIFPLYEKEELNCRLAVACAPGVPESVCVPEME